MVIIGLIFIIVELYYIANFSDLEKSVDQRLIMYQSTRWLLADLIYYILSFLYWVWIIALFFSGYKICALVLFTSGLLSVIYRWIFGKKLKTEQS